MRRAASMSASGSSKRTFRAVVFQSICVASASSSLNVKGAYLETFSDLLGSIAVIAAAVIILATGWLRADAVASMAV